MVTVRVAQVYAFGTCNGCDQEPVESFEVFGYIHGSAGGKKNNTVNLDRKK